MADDGYKTGAPTLSPESGLEARPADQIARKLLIPLGVLLVALIAIFYVFFGTSRVSGPSMVPTLLDGDRLLLTKGDPNPHRGDIIVTRVIEQGRPIELVKRVIGLPGDTVEIRDDVAIVNGVPEPQRGQLVVPSEGVSVPVQTIPADEMYLMGDNRPVSYDSRYLGPEPIAGASGKVIFIFSPITRIRFVP